MSMLQLFFPPSKPIPIFIYINGEMAFFLYVWLYLCLAFFSFSSLCDLFGWRRRRCRRRRTAITIHSASMDVMFESRIQKRNSMCWHQYANICRDANKQTKNRESIYLAKYLNRQKKWDINRISITVFVWYTSTGCVLHFALPWIFFFHSFLFSFHNIHIAYGK